MLLFWKTVVCEMDSERKNRRRKKRQESFHRDACKGRYLRNNSEEKRGRRIASCVQKESRGLSGKRKAFVSSALWNDKLNCSKFGLNFPQNCTVFMYIHSICVYTYIILLKVFLININDNRTLNEVTKGLSISQCKMLSLYP